MATARTLTETDLFRSYWDDGLLDVLSGLALLVTGLGWESELGALAVIQAPLWIVLWGPLRRRIVEPRAGFVEFSLARRKRSARGLWWTVALGVGALVLVILAALFIREHGAPAASRLLSPGLPAVLVALAAGLASLLTGARRFRAYGLVLLAGAAATVLLARGPALPLVVGGLVVAVSGALLLGRFVRDSREYEERP